jgi:dUTP pyrophosphatase
MADHPVNIGIKRSSHEVSLPKYATPGSSGMDVESREEVAIGPGERRVVGTGLSFVIPRGYELQVRPRSGLAFAQGVTVLNAPGTIDSDYRGEVQVVLINHSGVKYTVKPGTRIAQLVLCPIYRAVLEEVTELPQTERGAGGFGSTGQ